MLLHMLVYQYFGKLYKVLHNMYVFQIKGFFGKFPHIKQQNDGVEVRAQRLGVERKNVGPAEVLG